MLIADFPTIHECKEWVKADPYVTGKVWEKIDVVEYKMALKE